MPQDGPITLKQIDQMWLPSIRYTIDLGIKHKLWLPDAQWWKLQTARPTLCRETIPTWANTNASMGVMSVQRSEIY